MRYMKKGTVIRPLFVCDEKSLPLLFKPSKPATCAAVLTYGKFCGSRICGGGAWRGDAPCHEAWEAKPTSLKGTVIRPLFVSE